MDAEIVVNLGFSIEEGGNYFLEMYTYKNLIVWQKAIELVEEIYKQTSKFPKEEIYGLTSQMRRCSVSVPSNIAEGRLRGTEKEFRRFLFISYSSCGELETQIEISKKVLELKNVEYNKAEGLLTEVMKMLYTLINNLKEDD